MQNFAPIQNFWRSRRSSLRRSPRHSKAGFTLIEVLVVTLMIGVMFAIAAPGWLGFTQQRRVNSVNDAVVRALQDAQTQAKTKKLSYSVSFKQDNGIPEVAVYQTKILDDPNNPEVINPFDTNFKGWKPLGENLELKGKQVLLGTNVGTENSINSSISYSLNNTNKITFDYTGALPITPPPNLGTQGLIIVVAAPQSNDSNQALPSTRRCVKVSTLLGSIQTGRISSTGGGGDQCNPI